MHDEQARADGNQVTVVADPPRSKGNDRADVAPRSQMRGHPTAHRMADDGDLLRLEALACPVENRLCVVQRQECNITQR